MYNKNEKERRYNWIPGGLSIKDSTARDWIEGRRGRRLVKPLLSFTVSTIHTKRRDSGFRGWLANDSIACWKACL